MDQSYWAIEARINNAITFLDTNPDASIAKVARDFDVLPGRLQRRYTGYHSKSSRLPAGKVLSDEIEEALYEYIHQLDSFNILSRFIIVRKAVNYLLLEAGINRIVGDH